MGALSTLVGMETPPARRRRHATTTYSFGVSRRESHDATPFYSRFDVLHQDKGEGVGRYQGADQVFVADARNMAPIPDNSVALVVTSPPYFAGKEYETAVQSGSTPATYEHYLQMLRDVLGECVRCLEPGGRVAVNVANLGRKPYRSLSSDVSHILQNDLGLLLRGEILWIKAKGATGSCAWGSYASPANPVMRDVTERIVVASKGRMSRAIQWQKRQEMGLPYEKTIAPADFQQWTLDTWYIPPASATRVGHPAPFPVELPARLIQLHTFKHDLVLDPFMGAGTTAIAAIAAQRRWAGFELDAAYAEIAQRRVGDAINGLG